jgi:hypothetical protein
MAKLSRSTSCPWMGRLHHWSVLAGLEYRERDRLSHTTNLMNLFPPSSDPLPLRQGSLSLRGVISVAETPKLSVDGLTARLY